MSTKTKIAGLGKDFVSFMHEVLKNPKEQMVHKVNRLRQRYGKDWDEMGKAILIELGGELNLYSRKFNSTDAAIAYVAKRYGMSPKMVKDLFYATGAPFQYSGAQFELLKIKESKAAVLRKKLEALKSENTPWEAAKDVLLGLASGLKIRADDKRNIQVALSSANNYSMAESALFNMELAHQGMRTQIKMGSLNPPLLVKYLIPWSDRKLVERAQIASRNHTLVRLAAKPSGLMVLGDQAALHKTGLCQQSSSKFATARVARNLRSANLVNLRFYHHPPGHSTAELHIAEYADKAQATARKLLKHAPIVAAKVWDISGTPHLIKLN